MVMELFLNIILMLWTSIAFSGAFPGGPAGIDAHYFVPVNKRLWSSALF